MLTNEELNQLWLTHREAAFAHYGAITYRAAMRQWMPPAAEEASKAAIAELAAEREKTHAAWQAAWNATYPETPIGGFDTAYQAQQHTTAHLQAA